MPIRSWFQGLSRHHIILLGILAVAAVIRLYGIDYDLPFVYDADEPIYVTLALRMLKNHDLNPHWFGNPGTPYMYLLAVCYGLLFLGGRLLGFFHSAADFRAQYYADPTAFYLSGRILSLLFALATIWLVFRVGRRLRDPATGLLAAAVVALTPMHLLLSQQVRIDVPMTFLVLAAFWYCLNILERQDWKSYLLAGLLTGLATAVKYPAVIFALTIAITHFLTAPTWRLQRHGKLAGSAAACIAGAFLGSPFAFLDYRTLLKDVLHEARPEHLGATGAGFTHNFLWYLQGPLPNALSIAGALLAIVGAVLLLRSRWKQAVVLLSFPVLFLLFISSLHLRWERWIAPMLPLLGILVGLGISGSAELIGQRFGRRARPALAAALVLVVLAPLARGAVFHARQLAAPYSSTTARQWIVANLPQGSRVLVEVYGPLLPVGSFHVLVVEQNGSLAESHDSLAGGYLPGWDFGRIGKLAELTQQQVQYIVMTGEYPRFLRERARYAAQVASYQQLLGKGTLLYQLGDSSAVSRGPPVAVYQLR